MTFSFVQIIGWLSGICFAICGYPQYKQCKKQGHAHGVNPWFIGLWAAGEVGSMYYVYNMHGIDLPLFFNYTLNLIFITLILRYKFFPVTTDK